MFILLSAPQRRTREQVTLLVAFDSGSLEAIGALHVLVALETIGRSDLAAGFPVHDILLQVLPEAIYERMTLLPMAHQHAIWLLHQYNVQDLLQMGIKKYDLQAAVQRLDVANILTPEELVTYFSEQEADSP